MVTVFSVTARLGDTQGTPSDECDDDPVCVPQCFQLQIYFVRLNSKLLGFPNNKSTSKRMRFFHQREEEKVRE